MRGCAWADWIGIGVGARGRRRPGGATRKQHDQREEQRHLGHRQKMGIVPQKRKRRPQATALSFGVAG